MTRVLLQKDRADRAQRAPGTGAAECSSPRNTEGQLHPTRLRLFTEAAPGPERVHQGRPIVDMGSYVSRDPTAPGLCDSGSP